jgi:RNA polymerase sigma-70 factor, ECF subfamily
MIDEREFDVFYTDSYRRVVGQLFAMLGNFGEAEDAVQEAFCRAWQRRRRLSEYANPEAWVRTVAYRIAVSSWRKATHRVLAHRRHGVEVDVPGASPDHVALVAALRELPYEQRRLIVLYHLVGLSIAEIAAETDLPVGTVKSRLSRGRQALAPRLSDLDTADAGHSTRGA